MALLLLEFLNLLSRPEPGDSESGSALSFFNLAYSPSKSFVGGKVEIHVKGGVNLVATLLIGLPSDSSLKVFPYVFNKVRGYVFTSGLLFRNDFYFIRKSFPLLAVGYEFLVAHYVYHGFLPFKRV